MLLAYLFIRKWHRNGKTINYPTEWGYRDFFVFNVITFLAGAVGMSILIGLVSFIVGSIILGLIISAIIFAIITYFWFRRGG